MDFASIKQITIPEGDVKQIAIGGDIVWKKRPNQSEVQYIEKTGTTESYFNTGFVPLWNDVIKSKYSTTVDDTKFLYMARQRSNRPCNSDLQRLQDHLLVRMAICSQILPIRWENGLKL